MRIRRAACAAGKTRRGWLSRGGSSLSGGTPAGRIPRLYAAPSNCIAQYVEAFAPVASDDEKGLGGTKKPAAAEGTEPGGQRRSEKRRPVRIGHEPTRRFNPGSMKNKSPQAEDLQCGNKAGLERPAPRCQ